MARWAVVGVIGAAAALISTITGIFSGNPAGVIIFRALLSAIVCGAITFAGRYILHHYIPDLFATVVDAAKTVVGRDIDIVLPEENPHVPVADENQSIGELHADPEGTPKGSEEDVEHLEVIEPLEADGSLEPVGDPGGPSEVGETPNSPGEEVRKTASSLGDPSQLAKAIRSLLNQNNG